MSAARSRSPCNTTMSTAGWLSSAVLNVSVRRAGIVVLRSMTLVITPPIVSMPSDSGVTSSSSTSRTSPLMTAAWIAAPSATTSSGLTVMFGSLPPVSRRTRFCTAGIRVEPPTRMTSSMSLAVTLASAMACCTGPWVRSTRSAVSCSNVDRISVVFRCFGPLASAVTNGRLIVVWVTDDSSTLAFSAASKSRCSACGSRRRSMPSCLRNSSAMWSTIRRSKSSPPRWVSPAVARTSTTPSPTSSRLTSNVPPPRSNTRMVSCWRLSSPYASAAAVGSLMIRSTSRPAMRPASLVACRCASLKYAGTVMTASVTRSPRNLDASSASLRRTSAEISSGAYNLSRTLNRTAPSGPATTSNETALISLLTSS